MIETNCDILWNVSSELKKYNVKTFEALTPTKAVLKGVKYMFKLQNSFMYIIFQEFPKLLFFVLFEELGKL